MPTKPQAEPEARLSLEQPPAAPSSRNEEGLPDTRIPQDTAVLTSSQRTCKRRGGGRRLQLHPGPPRGPAALPGSSVTTWTETQRSRSQTNRTWGSTKCTNRTRLLLLNVLCSFGDRGHWTQRNVERRTKSLLPESAKWLACE